MRILDESNNEITEPNLDLGYLKAESLFVTHHEAIPERERIERIDYENPIKVYPNGGKIVGTIVEQEYQAAQDAWDEYEDIQRYILYTEDELKAIEERKKAEEQARKEEEERAAAAAKKEAEREEFLEGAPERVTGVEEANLDQDELLIALNDSFTQAQLDTDEAITTMYEMINGGTNE